MATRRFSDDDAEVDALYRDVAEADLQPLWKLEGLLPRHPQTMGPHLWPAKTLRTLAERSGDLIGIDRGGDRRVLGLAHPDLGGLPYATPTLWGAVQYLGPHELAPAHRHSPAAVRFVLEGSGVFTLVDGDPIAMAPGDLVLTPSWSWHEHHNLGDQPMIWFDGLDVPLVRNLDAVFFEPGPDELSTYEATSVSRSERRYGHGGLRPLTGDGAETDRHSPLMVYRWGDTDRALDAMLAADGGPTAALRFVDPLTGRDMMPTMRAEMHRLVPGHRTPTIRSAGSGMWVVHRGSGTSVIGGRRFEWGPGDVFVVPSWAAVDHEAHDRADLFLISDGPVIEALGLARTETLREHQDVTG